MWRGPWSPMSMPVLWVPPAARTGAGVSCEARSGLPRPRGTRGTQGQPLCRDPWWRGAEAAVPGRAPAARARHGRCWAPGRRHPEPMGHGPRPASLRAGSTAPQPAWRGRAPPSAREGAPNRCQRSREELRAGSWRCPPGSAGSVAVPAGRRSVCAAPSPRSGALPAPAAAV